MNAPFAAAALEESNVFHDERDNAWHVELFGSGDPHPVYVGESRDGAEKIAKKIAKAAVDAGSPQVDVRAYTDSKGWYTIETIQ